ncbi:hypothetical protein EHS25_003240 [Saitozyma podzolica]|uniref:Lipocalin/cytosolic fatty-acid binding domain-containing protein n=1 Tax=Saitozyma podzolica TaxID=1890683 RepID=A0A427Y8B4_9TREE|nr:hypothetical protein EHS25_003240 [Saitozyma podzolica]
MTSPTSPSSPSITIHPPGSADASLRDAQDGADGFDRAWFMGTWNVAWSTLPMWKDKKNVNIHYVSLTDESRPTKFESTVSYIKQSQPDTASPSTVRGVEALTPGTNGATFDWRGRNWLFFVHSHWEVLGYGDDQAGLEWAVTFFSKTLFTPAGIDIYVRPSRQSDTADVVPPPQDARNELVGRIAAALQGATEEVVQLASGGFEVPVSP